MGHHADVSRLIASVRGVVALGLLALGIVACTTGIPPQAFIDGLPIGESVACGVVDCGRFSDFALADLDTREPDHVRSWLSRPTSPTTGRRMGSGC